MKLIFITGHRRSGSTLLGSLLDDVKGLCVYPGDISILYAYYPHFNNNNYSFTFKIKKIEKIIKKTLNEREKTVKKKINFENFIKSFISKINNKNIDNIEKILKILISSYLKFYCKKFKKKDIKYFVFKETSCSHLVLKINRYFKDIKFLFILRDPRAIYSSLKSGLNKYYKEDNLILMESMIKRLSIDDRFITLIKDFLNKKIKIIKYEKLVDNPRKLMREISNFMSIKFDKKSLIPTVLGHKSLGNSYNIVISGISKKRKNNWKKSLTFDEINVIELFLQSYFNNFGYTLKNRKIDHEAITKYYNKVNSRFFFIDRFK
tara:strand:+ start:2773 stop:3732 length:960 start_codon:yes stop_codon:yes gene_type:complete